MTCDQLIKVWREGHAKGMSWGYILLVWIGFVFMAPYAIVTHAKMALIYSYVLQSVAFTIMIVRKRFPRVVP